MSILLAPLWAGIIVLILYSLWLLTASFSDAVALGEVRLHVLSLLGLVATFVGLLAAPYVIFMIFMAERRTRATEESWAKLAKKKKKQVWDLTHEERSSVASFMPPRPDIQAALTILGRRDDRAPGRLDYEDANSFVLDLRGSNIAYADLNNSNLGPVLLDDANLQGASLSVAKL